MTDFIAHARMLFAYDRRANDKIFGQASLLSDAQLEAPGAASFESIRGNMAHIRVANVTWYERLAGDRVDPVDMTAMESERAGFAASYTRWERFLAIMAPDDWMRILAYRDSQGIERERPYGLLLTHVVNHSTFHRA